MEPVTKAALKTAQIMVGAGKTWTYIPPLELVALQCQNIVVWEKKKDK